MRYDGDMASAYKALCEACEEGAPYEGGTMYLHAPLAHRGLWAERVADAIRDARLAERIRCLAIAAGAVAGARGADEVASMIADGEEV